MSRAILISAVIIGVMGCAGNRARVGSQRVVERTPNKVPSWIGQSSWEKGENIFYVGAAPGRADFALGLREAKADAEKKLVEQIRQKIRTEFGSAVEGQNVDGQMGNYVKDVITKVSENIAVSGAIQDDSYFEKVEERTGSGVRYAFNCWTTVRLKHSDYLEARRSASVGAVAEARKVNNARAEATLKRAFEKLENTAPATVLSRP